MSSLLLNIQTAGIQSENVTSDVLAEILNGIPACKETFLNLFGTNIPISSNKIVREEGVTNDEEKGRADFTYRSDNCVAVIENKPWDDSSVGGQLSSYAKVMRNWNETHKYLCLLSVEANQERLLNEIAHVEKVSVSALADTFLKKYNVVFVERTWERVLHELDSVEPKHEALSLWTKILRDRIIPKKVILTPEDINEKNRLETPEVWGEIQKRVVEIQNIIRIKCTIWGFGKPIKLVPGSTCHGFYLYDGLNNDIPYWVGANLQTWELFRPDHCLFIIRAHTEDGSGKKKRRSIVMPENLTSSGFKFDEASKTTYICPLISSSEENISPESICPKAMAEKALRAMNAVRDAIAFGVK